MMRGECHGDDAHAPLGVDFNHQGFNMALVPVFFRGPWAMMVEN